MKKKLIFTYAFILLTAYNLTPQNSLAWQRANTMGKGINMPNWLEAGWLGDYYPAEPPYTYEDLDVLKSVGIKTVRLPIIFEWITDENPPYQPLPTASAQKAFKYVDTIIKWTTKLNMNVIIDNHHGRDLTDENYQAQIPRLTGMWKNLAQRYGDLNPDRHFFELRNEPKNDINNPNLRTVQQAIINAIRQVNTTHTLIVGANWWNAGWALVQETTPYTDDNIIYTFHNYTPYEYTHQQVSWANWLPAATWPDQDRGWTEESLKNEFLDVKTWSNTQKVPVFLGEFGVVTPADAESRCRWISAVGKVLAEINIPWAYWDVKYRNESFGIFTDQTVATNEITPCFKAALGLNNITVQTTEHQIDAFIVRYEPQTANIYITAPTLKTGNIHIYNVAGKQIYQGTITNQKKQINASEWAKGVYIAVIKNTAKGTIQSTKIIIY